MRSKSLESVEHGSPHIPSSSPLDHGSTDITSATPLEQGMYSCLLSIGWGGGGGERGRATDRDMKREREHCRETDERETERAADIQMESCR
jgi:hypothetical protein